MSSTPAIVLRPMQWADLTDIGDVQPLSEQDLPVLAAIRDVLRAHGATGRFGITLLHKHFDLEPHERLLESTNAATRTLTLQVVPSDHGTAAIGTMWRFDAHGELDLTTVCECPWNPIEHRHAGYHERR